MAGCCHSRNGELRPEAEVQTEQPDHLVCEFKRKKCHAVIPDFVTRSLAPVMRRKVNPKLPHRHTHNVLQPKNVQPPYPNLPCSALLFNLCVLRWFINSSSNRIGEVAGLLMAGEGRGSSNPAMKAITGTFGFTA